MPSAKILEQKQAMLAELVETMKNSESGVLVNYCGITVEEDTKLRKSLREAGVDYRVVKNTYIKKAAAEAGLNGFDNVLEGMTAIAMSSDAVAPAKILCKYAKDNENFTVKAGFIDGRVIDVAEVEALAAIPGKEGLIAKMLGSIQSPLYGLAVALQAIVDKSGEAPAEAPAEA
ncbi:MAG: 50S ribosomal protein L10 [Clostridia bacterium]|nr:50S ribosomal protein L10 [Clostridia bacterium]